MNTTFDLPALFDMAAAIRLQQQMLEHLAEHNGGISINAATVDRITTPAIQLLIAASKELEETGRILEIKDPSAAVTRAFSMTGLSRQLNEWSQHGKKRTGCR